MANLTQGLSSLYSRIKKKECCPEWRANPQEFYAWYNQRFERQSGLCQYCHLPGDTEKSGYGKYFREGRRGKRLEVDRIESKEPYSPENCVLACYPCNNAKSDVFSYREFMEIGKTIGRVVKLRTRPWGVLRLFERNRLNSQINPIESWFHHSSRANNFNRVFLQYSAFKTMGRLFTLNVPFL